MTKKEHSLEDMKKEYLNFQKKYKLPSFDELNKEFNIEKISENETDYILREIRKAIAEKLFNYLRFIETLLNPVNAPTFIFSVTKSIDTEDKKVLGEIYKKLAKNEIELVKIDLVYSEKSEADFIKESCKTWDEIKKDLSKIIEKTIKNFDNKTEGKSKRYLG